MKPVALPPGRAKLLTNPAPTGSGTIVNTIGTARVSCSNGATVMLPVAWVACGGRATNSSPHLRMLSGAPEAQPESISTFGPTAQHRPTNIFVKAEESI